MKPEQLHEHGMKEIQTSTEKLSKLEHRWDWTYYGNIQNHKAMREASLEKFIRHYKSAYGSNDYITAVLPRLPLADDSFGLLLCSHFLFLYHEQFNYAFHLQAIKELIRVCRRGGEVRLSPVVTLEWDPYPSLERLVKELHGEGHGAVLMPSRLLFIPGSSLLLHIQKKAMNNDQRVDLSL